MNTKINELISSVEEKFKQIEQLEQSLRASYANLKNPSKSDKLSIGSNVMKLNQLNTEIVSTIDMYLNYMEGSLDNFSKVVSDYYSAIKELQKPIEEIENEDLRKFKELINSKN